MSLQASGERPLFLVTNDDGVDAPGILALSEAVRDLGEVVIVAPMTERSGASQAITLLKPFKAETRGEGIYAIDANPVDCVLFALRNALPRRPDWVLSGINRGPNLGDDTLYSGTVGAALTGCLNGTRGMAVSLADFSKTMHYETAARVVRLLLGREELLEPAAGGVVNVNVPNLPFAELKGIRVSTLARRHYDETIHVERDMLDETVCWYGKGRAGHDELPGRDCSDVDRGFVTLSVLKPSLLDLPMNERLKAIMPQDLERLT